MNAPWHRKREVVSLVDIYTRPRKDRLAFLYALLKERTPEQSISHKKMPTLKEHEAFVEGMPYRAWYEINANGTPVGSIYITWNGDLGISILTKHQRKGYGKRAIESLMELHPGPFYANVNPANEASRKLWESLGGKLIQVTYAIPRNRS